MDVYLITGLFIMFVAANMLVCMAFHCAKIAREHG